MTGTRIILSHLVAFTSILPLAVACGGGNDNTADRSSTAGAGMGAVGGSVDAGGTSSGGAMATGGGLGVGGVIGSGGATGAGGATGGATGQGGVSQNLGGAPADAGGSPSGGADLGVGGMEPAAGGADVAVGGQDTGEGGSDSGVGGENPGTGGDSSVDFVEDSGTNCTIPSLPAANSLPAIPLHPDPFLMIGGSRITTKAEWVCRRAEIKAQAEQYEYGEKPTVAEGDVTADFNNGTLSVTVSNGGSSIDFTIDISRPSGSPTGPIPLVIAYGSPDATMKQVFDTNHVATAKFSPGDFGAETNPKSGKFYTLYSGTQAGVLMAQA